MISAAISCAEQDIRRQNVTRGCGRSTIPAALLGAPDEGGHRSTFRAACKLRDAGLSSDEALAILSVWNETNASPP